MPTATAPAKSFGLLSRLFRAPAGEILEMLLLHRTTHAIIDHAARDLPAKLARRVSSMLAYLQQTLRNEKMLARYQAIEAIRIENLTYAIHVGPLAVLVTAIAGKNTEDAVARCRAVSEELHTTKLVALSDAAHHTGNTGLLPDLAALTPPPELPAAPRPQFRAARHS